MMTLSPEEHFRLAREWELRREKLRRRSQALTANVPGRILDEIEAGLDTGAETLLKLQQHLAEGHRLVVLIGSPGTGKTTAAVVTLLEHDRPGRFITAPEYCRQARSWSTEALADGARRTTGVLVIDDLGEEPNGHDDDIDVLITSRYNLGGPSATVFTSNLRPRELVRYGDRVLSRLRDPRYCAVVHCSDVLRPRRESG